MKMVTKGGSDYKYMLPPPKINMEGMGKLKKEKKIHCATSY
jgi:hypothetical protein